MTDKKSKTDEHSNWFVSDSGIRMGAKKRIWITFGGGCIWDMVCLHDQAKKIAIILISIEFVSFVGTDITKKIKLKL